MYQLFSLNIRIIIFSHKVSEPYFLWKIYQIILQPSLLIYLILFYSLHCWNSYTAFILNLLCLIIQICMIHLKSISLLQSLKLGRIKNQLMRELQNLQATHQLNGRNYLQWSQLLKSFLKGMGKLSHLIGTGQNLDDPKFSVWDKKDSMIMSGLWISMKRKISGSCMFLMTMKEILEAVQQTYFKVQDVAHIYEN